MKLEIPNKIYEEILEQAKAEVPFEACGILAGSDGRVEKLYKMTNVEKSSIHFTMEPKEQFTVIKDIRSSSLELLAIYHSHPTTPARLSQEDIRLSLTPDVTYLILSLQDSNNPLGKGFQVDNGNIIEVPIEILED